MYITSGRVWYNLYLNLAHLIILVKGLEETLKCIWLFQIFNHVQFNAFLNIFQWAVVMMTLDPNYFMRLKEETSWLLFRYKVE